MLPDYPKVKVRIGKLYHDKIKQAHDSALGPPFDLPSCQMHEGEAGHLQREDGSDQEILPKRIGAKAELPIDIREYEKLTLKDIE